MKLATELARPRARAVRGMPSSLCQGLDVPLELLPSSMLCAAEVLTRLRLLICRNSQRCLAVTSQQGLQLCFCSQVSALRAASDLGHVVDRLHSQLRACWNSSSKLQVGPYRCRPQSIACSKWLRASSSQSAGVDRPGQFFWSSDPAADLQKAMQALLGQVTDTLQKLEQTGLELRLHSKGHQAAATAAAKLPVCQQSFKVIHLAFACLCV